MKLEELPRDLAYADAHLHSNPLKGYGAEVIGRRFKESGGWFMALIGLPPTSLGFKPDLEGFTRSIEILLNECSKLRGTGLKVACLGGFHPAMVDKMIDNHRMSPEKVYEISLEIIRYVEKLIREGFLDGVAEVGRPHYKTSPEYVVLSEMILDSALEMIKENNAIAHLHLEEGGWITAQDISKRIRRFSLDPWRVVLHHSRPKNLRPAVEMGLVASVPALIQIIENIRTVEKRYVFESDFLDDPERPGKPMFPWDVISTSKISLEKGFLTAEDLYVIHIDNIEKIYGVKPP
ncbi:MAG: TatD family hydrolase [Sulfolobales archaeon]